MPFICVNQIPEGKTNHGNMLYGRATRHRDVRLCSVGALVFYLGYRFDITEEFKNFTVDDWCNNKKWFDVKLLADAWGTNNTKIMQLDGYGKAVCAVCQ